MIKELLIIPKPVSFEFKSGSFEFSEDIGFQTDEPFKHLTETFFEQLYRLIGFKAKIISDVGLHKNCVKIIFDENFEHYEGYKLVITKELIILSSNNPAGMFYGLQTLLQLLIQGIAIPCVEIIDYPRFSWRGFMLDEARHFFGIEEVKKLLDVMAMLKFNIFHWHLTDDQGWRIQIDKYPLLNEISSKRSGTSTDARKLMSDLQRDRTKIDGIPVSGLYKKSQIKEIIQYAKERFITIIPEVDFPGHVQAILAAYPELSCTGGPFEVSVKFGVHKDVFCIGKEKVFNFSQDILEEVITLFPSNIIHTGGDEVPVRRYKKCPDCQALIKKAQLKSENDLQPYYTAKIVKFLEENNRTLMGWNEILSDNLSEQSINQFWAGDFNTTLEHVKKGRKTVMSDMRYVYLNYPYKLTPISQTYDYEPIPNDLDEKFHKNILGVEACLWSEYVPDIETLEYQVFPRLIAIAETGWTMKGNKDFPSFEMRMQNSFKILDKFKINYAKSDEFEIKY